MADGAVAQFWRKWSSEVEGRTLVVGSKCYGQKPDRRLLYREAIGIDLFEGEGVDHVHDLEQPLPYWMGKFDHVDCASVLEHVRHPWKMAENIEAALKPGGSIYVQVPFAWRIHDYPGDFWRMTAEALDVLFPSIEWRSRKYAVGDRLRKMVPGSSLAGGVMVSRAELVGFGRKCA